VHVNTILTLDIMTRLITDDTGDQSLPHYYHIIIEKNSINNGTACYIRNKLIKGL